MIEPTSEMHREALLRMVPLSEVFNSVQGEGTRIGQLCTFIRIQGCNMDPPCSWCDTAYAQPQSPHGIGVTVGSLLTTQVYNILHRVVLTGGEPLSHVGTHSLLYALSMAGHIITVETNATIFDREVARHTSLVSLSPKLPSSGHEPVMRVIRAWMEVADTWCQVQIKMCVDGYSLDDLDMVAHVLECTKDHAHKNVPIILQPVSRTHSEFQMDSPVVHSLNLRNLLKAVEARFGNVNRDIRVLPQLHKILWGNKRGI